MRRIAKLIAAGLLFAPASARADAVSDFYHGKTVDLMIGFSAGGAYDVYGRLVGRFIGRHIPGAPNVVPRNMDGAGSLRAANYLYQVAPKDGTAIATFGRGVAFDPILGLPGSAFDATKFSWLGSANDEVSTCVAYKGSGVSTIEDAEQKELIVGGSGGSADTDQQPKVLNGVLGTKMKLVVGYPGGNDINLAMERGEVKGRCGWSWSSLKSTHADWLRDKTVSVFIQLALHKHPDLPDVPLVMDLAKTDADRRILELVFARQVMGRPFAAPPGVPKDRLAALRQAFDDTMKDPDFLAEAAKIDVEITPVSGEKLQGLVDDVYHDTTPDIAAKAGALLK